MTSRQFDSLVTKATPRPDLELIGVGAEVALYYCELPVKVATVTRSTEQTIFIGDRAFSRHDGTAISYSSRARISAKDECLRLARDRQAREEAARREIDRHNRDYAAREDVRLTREIFDGFENTSLEERRAILVRKLGLANMRVLANWLK